MLKQIRNRCDMESILHLIAGIPRLPYLQDNHIQQDFENQELYAWVESDRILGIGSLVWDEQFQMLYIKRIQVFQEGLGIGKSILTALSSKADTVAITPFHCNIKMITLIQQLGFIRFATRIPQLQRFT